MTDENRPPAGAQPGRRRPAPTIDLQATEVQAESADSRVEAPSEPAASDASAAEPPPKPEEPFIPPPSETPHAEQSEPPPRRRRFVGLSEDSWSHVGTGIAGAAGGVLIVLLLWLLGAFSSRPAPSNDLSPRLAAIETQLREFAARPAPLSADPKVVEEVAARLGRLEGAQAQSRAPVTDPIVLGRLNATENAVKSLADNVAALSRRSDGIEAALTRRTEQIEAGQRETQRRLDTLATTLADLQSTVRDAAAGRDRAVRLAVSAAALREAIERGSPFAAELAIVKPLASDASVLAPLEAFASAGVPGTAALARELTALLQPMRSAGELPRDSGFLERLQANAEKLVRIRPVDEARSDPDDRGAIVGRLAQHAARADIPGALAEIAKLPPEARAPFAAWAAKAEARGQAIETSRRFATNAVAALKAAP